MNFKEIESAVVQKRPISEHDPIHIQACYQALRYLYADFGRGNIDAEHAKQEKRRIRCVFDWANTQYETSAKLRAQWVESVKVSESFRAKLRHAINTGENIESMFYLACTCIAVMTGDETLSGGIVKTQIEQIKFSEVSNV